MPERIRIGDLPALSEKEILILIAGAVNENGNDIADMHGALSDRINSLEVKVAALEKLEEKRQNRADIVNSVAKSLAWLAGIMAAVWAFIETIVHFTKHG